MTIPLTPATRPDWLAYITRTPALLDVLWDLGVLPEQIEAGSHEDLTMLRIASVWSLAAEATREACAQAIAALIPDPVEVDPLVNDFCRHALAAIRARP